MSNLSWWPKEHESWNCAEPDSSLIPGQYPAKRMWWARAWPWPDQKPYVGSGYSKEEALSALRKMIAEDCGYDRQTT